ncbi:MAG TPA: hypothetical protein PLG33_06590, partial [Prolixibacteraceae bacterium]|nr:hypothetical protein [Prolixibacteraceae bacterium]
MAQEFIIALTEHRAIGNIFVPMLIEPERSYYTVKKTVKMRDYKSGEVQLNEHELELLKLIENYSDENLAKKFSKKKEKGNFFQEMDEDMFQNHVSPYIDKYMYRCVMLLMKSQTRLFYKQAKYSSLYDEDIIHINPTFSKAIFYFNRDEKGTRYNLRLTHEGKTVEILHKTVRMVCTMPCCFVLLNRLYIFNRLSGKKLIPFQNKTFIAIPQQAEEKYFQTFVLNIIKE